jgi:hypothetical protein
MVVPVEKDSPKTWRFGINNIQYAYWSHEFILCYFYWPLVSWLVNFFSFEHPWFTNFFSIPRRNWCNSTKCRRGPDICEPTADRDMRTEYSSWLAVGPKCRNRAHGISKLNWSKVQSRLGIDIHYTEVHNF